MVRRAAYTVTPWILPSNQAMELWSLLVRCWMLYRIQHMEWYISPSPPSYGSSCVYICDQNIFWINAKELWKCDLCRYTLLYTEHPNINYSPKPYNHPQPACHNDYMWGYAFNRHALPITAELTLRKDGGCLYVYIYIYVMCSRVLEM